MSLMTSFTNIAVPAAAGVADEVMERWDRRRGRTAAFQNATDIARVVGAGLGYGIQLFFPRYSALGTTLAISFTPLLTKSLAKVIAPTGVATQSAMASDFVARRRASASRSQQQEFAEGRVL